MSWVNIIAILAIFVVSFLSVSSGGIALLSRPILIFAGIPPEVALGTFRVANLIGRLTGLSAVLQRHGIKMDWKLGFVLFVTSLLGGVVGAEIVTRLPGDAIKKVLGAFILVMGVIFLMRRDMSFVERHEKISQERNMIGITGTVMIGIISAFIGGAGILFSYLLIFVYNKSYLSSVPIRKIASFGSAFSSSIFFAIHGDVRWWLMIGILCAGLLGEYLGTRYPIRRKEEWIRAASLLVLLATGITLLFI